MSRATLNWLAGNSYGGWRPFMSPNSNNISSIPSWNYKANNDVQFADICRFVTAAVVLLNGFRVEGTLETFAVCVYVMQVCYQID